MLAGPVLLGIALLAAICAALLLAAAAVCGALSRGASTSELAADIVLIAVALAMAICSLLIVSGGATLVTVSASCLGAGVVALALDGRASAARLRAVGTGALGVVGSSWFAWLLPAFALCAIARGLSLPQLSWDGLTYHLTYPASWIQHGGASRFEAGGVFEAYETFPKGGETLFYLAMLPFHGDTLVNLANLPSFIGLALAVRACAQRLGVSRALQDGSAAAITLCPAFAAYVTPAYVEVTSAFAFAAGLGAALRALAGEPKGLVLLGLAVGVAIATKLTGLHLLALFVLIVLFCARREVQKTARAAALGTLAMFAVGAPFYLRNVVLCQNPFYPAPLPGFETGPSAGSTVLRFTLEQSSVLAQGALGRVLENLVAPPWQGYPLGPANAYFLALALPWLVFLSGARPQRRKVLLLYALAACELCIYLVSPWNGIFAGANTRFLGPSLIAAGLASALALDAASGALRAVLGALALATPLAYLARAPVVAQPVPCVPALVSVFALATSFLCMALALRAEPQNARSYRMLGALGLACTLAALPSAALWRDQHRLASYAHATDLHPLPSASKELWPLVAGLPASRIAFAVGGVDSGEGWFFYPLFGADLRHAVSYIDVEADGDRASCLRRGEIRDRPDFDAWQRRLRARGIDYLATHGAPLEERWAEAHPELFARVASLPHSTLFRVERNASARAKAAAGR